MRPTIDQYWTSHLRLVAERATCLRRKTGALITDATGAILSSGYNGVPRGIPHCGSGFSPCRGEGAGEAPGTGVRGDTANENTSCWAVHAEQNAILRCHRIDLAHTIYCTNLPCFTCAKMIANTPIRRVVALEDYPGDRRGLLLLGMPRVPGPFGMEARPGLEIRIGNHRWSFYEGAMTVHSHEERDNIL